MTIVTMKHPLLTSLSLAALVGTAFGQPVAGPVSSAAPFALVTTARAQDPAADKNPEIAAKIEKAKGLWGDRKGAKDADVIAVIDELNQAYKTCGPKDKASIVSFLGKSFELKRDEVSEGVPNNKIMLAAAVSLGEMGSEAVKTLEAWIDHKALRKDLALQSRLILSLGKTKDAAATKTLIKLLEHKDAPLVSAAAQGLGEFDKVDLKIRKDAFESMLKVLMSALNTKDSNPQDLIAKDRYDVIASPIITSLGKLSGHNERDPQEWQRWWNKNKSKDWDKAE
jgi:hypothetical protein